MKMALLPMLLLLSCGQSGSKDLRPDSNPPSESSNYPSAEFFACGKRWHGMGVCEYTPGQPFTFQIQTLNEGSLRVSFANGQPDIITSYVGNKPYDVKVEPYEKGHIISFVVTPQFKSSVETIHSFRGHLYLKANKIPMFVYTGKYRPTSKEYIVIPVEKAAKVDVRLIGCEQDLIKTDVPVVDNAIKVSISELNPKVSKLPCMYEGAIRSPEYKKELAWFAAIYNPDFVPLAIPVVQQKSFNRKRIVITADTTVSVITMDDNQMYLGNKAEFDFSENKPHILRVLTVAGRSAIGSYIPKAGWSWQQ